MKKLKVLLSVLLSAMLVLSMAAPAFAAQEGELTGGTINITNAKKDQTYSIYQLLYLESYNDTLKIGAYKVNSAWAEFFAVGGAGYAYITVEDGGYITFKDDADIEAFVKAAKEYVDTKALASDAPTQTPDADKQISFTNLKLGWYLVDSTLGTLCSIDTTQKSVNITDKNTIPTIDKVVEEDSTGAFGAENTAQIGQDVNFKITVGAKKGAQGYIVRDIMDAGLAFNNDIVIKVGNVTLDAREDQEDTDYDYSVALNQEIDEETYTFVITFNQDYLDGITADTDIVITYSAKLDEDALINDANENTATLVYGENPDFIEDTTETFTYEIDVVKVNTSNEVLPGAEFKLYTAATGGDLIQLVKIADGEYELYDGTNGTPVANGLIVATSGKIVIRGLDINDSYYIEETKAPDGYNKLTERKEIELTTGSNNATFAQDGKYSAGGLRVENRAGTLLPETGGTGTKVLFTVGGIMMVVAFVLITSKRRMAAEK